jgi:hypothetical protein
MPATVRITKTGVRYLVAKTINSAIKNVPAWFILQK